MQKALHLRDDRDGLYVSKKKEGKGLANTEDGVGVPIQGRQDYI